ncbi:MAG: hypothetical protein Q9170_004786 [Blastenia crenularia]
MAVRSVGSPGSIIIPFGEKKSIDPPSGFSCKFRRGGQDRSLPSKDLYSATLHALLHFSLQDYSSRAETYATRGPEPRGNVVVNAVPFVLPAAYTINSHLVWGLFYSVVAYNSPSNVRETIASVFIHGLPVADIDYLQASQAPVATEKIAGKPSRNLTSASALQMSSTSDRDLVNLGAYHVSFHFVPGGIGIRRESAYDAIAYSILWTAQFKESTRFTGLRQISVPGGRVVVRFMSYQLRGHDPLTLGFAATIVKTIPQTLESLGNFQESFMLVHTADNEICGQIGIWYQDAVIGNGLHDNGGNLTGLVQATS